MKIFVLTDNRAWYEKIVNWRLNRCEVIEIFCSPNGKELFSKEIDNGNICTVDLKSDYCRFLNGYDFGFSCHSKQIFPSKLVSAVKCFNVHPGLNPYNRGWFPQVFSIINGLPIGATIHEMDEEIDHGAVVAQEAVEVLDSDTSKMLYEKIIAAEFRLFDECIESILEGEYQRMIPESSGNYNSILDFKKLCELDLDKKLTLRETLNYLRAMTFDGYDNAFFHDKNGRKVYVSINLKAED